MNLINRHKLATFFALLFMIIITAPTVAISLDDNADVALFFGENEEEEKENLKILFDFASSDSDLQDVVKESFNNDEYTFKTYSKPHLNLIFPPPDYI